MFAYWRERLPARVFGPVAVALAAPPHVLAWSGAVALGEDALLAELLLAQFRLWDDLADRTADAARAPHRVLARATRVGRYVAVCVLVGCANAIFLMRRPHGSLALLLLAALTGALAFTYTRQQRTAATEALRLAKYPVFVLALAIGRPAASPLAGLCGAAAAFLIACAYEIWHDRTTPLRLRFRSAQ